MPRCQILPCIKPSKQYSIKVEQFQFLAKKKKKNPAVSPLPKLSALGNLRHFSPEFIVMQALGGFLL